MKFCTINVKKDSLNETENLEYNEVKTSFEIDN